MVAMPGWLRGATARAASRIVVRAASTASSPETTRSATRRPRRVSSASWTAPGPLPGRTESSRKWAVMRRLMATSLLADQRQLLHPALARGAHLAEVHAGSDGTTLVGGAVPDH